MTVDIITTSTPSLTTSTTFWICIAVMILVQTGLLDSIATYLLTPTYRITPTRFQE